MDTFSSRCRERSRNEEGMALIGVILLLILASGVCAALAISGQTETKTAYNLDTYAHQRRRTLVFQNRQSDKVIHAPH